jgi:hypothetical protein
MENFQTEIPRQSRCRNVLMPRLRSDAIPRLRIDDFNGWQSHAIVPSVPASQTSVLSTILVPNLATNLFIRKVIQLKSFYQNFLVWESGQQSDCRLGTFPKPCRHSIN